MSVYAFILCLCCPVYRYRPCDGLITHPKSPSICVKHDYGTEEEARGPVRAVRTTEKNYVSEEPASNGEIPFVSCLYTPTNQA
jgi:hypothetical protein